MASVAPQVTVISRSGSTDQPGTSAPSWRRSPARSGRAPQVIAYWLMSASMAAQRRLLDLRRAREVGEALGQIDGVVLRCASRVISRMTDSVKAAALREMAARAVPSGAAVGLPSVVVTARF